MKVTPVGSPQLDISAPRLDGQGGTAGVARILPYEVREGGDGDEISVNADVLFQFLDEQSRSLRDFIRFAREE